MNNVTLIIQLAMMNKLKKIWEEYMNGISLGIALIVLAGVMFMFFRTSRNADEMLSMESTSEKVIKAKNVCLQRASVYLSRSGQGTWVIKCST